MKTCIIALCRSTFKQKIHLVIKFSFLFAIFLAVVNGDIKSCNSSYSVLRINVNSKQDSYLTDCP